MKVLEPRRRIPENPAEALTIPRRSPFQYNAKEDFAVGLQESRPILTDRFGGGSNPVPL